MTTAYEVVAGKIRPVVPVHGPCTRDGVPCRIKIHHLRPRKTGIPWRFVAVAQCQAHGTIITLYPPGHVPYGREPLVALGPDGSELTSGAGEREVPTSSGYFAATGAAARGERWRRDSAPSPPDAVRSTQRRRMARAAMLLGLEAGTSPEPEAVADVTGLPAGELLETLGRLAHTRDLCRRGREIWGVLVRLTHQAGRALMDRLAVLGHRAGLWGHPYRWRPRSWALLELGRPFWREGWQGTAAPSSASATAEPFYDFGPRHPP